MAAAMAVRGRRRRSRSRSRSRSRRRRILKGGARGARGTTAANLEAQIGALQKAKEQLATSSEANLVTQKTIDLSDESTRDLIAEDRTAAYLAERADQWMRRTIDGKVSTAALQIKQTQIDKLDDTDEETFSGDRLVYCLPRTTSRVILFPPVSGNPSVYKQCKKIIEDEVGSAIYPNTVFLFTGLGVSDPSNPILIDFLALRETYKDRIFLFVYRSPNNLKVLKETFPLLYEPSYIVYPFPKRDAGGAEWYGYIFTASVPEGGAAATATGSEVFVPDTKQPLRLLSISDMANGIVTPSSKVDPSDPTETHIRYYAFPPDPLNKDTLLYPDPATLRKGYKLISRTVTNLAEADVYIFYEAAPPPDLAALDAAEKFQVAPDSALALHGVSQITVKLGPNAYAIRSPVYSGVRENWEALLFTEDEVELLHDLNFRPKILSDIFGAGNWRKELARFLDISARSNCFEDQSLLSNRQCQTSRKFVNTVYDYFLKHDERVSGLREREEELEKEALKLRLTGAQVALQAATQPPEPSKGTIGLPGVSPGSRDTVGPGIGSGTLPVFQNLSTQDYLFKYAQITKTVPPEYTVLEFRVKSSEARDQADATEKFKTWFKTQQEKYKDTHILYY